MTYMFFDTETTGLPEDFNVPPSEWERWPRIVQLAWVVCSAGGETIDTRDAIVQPEGFEIPEAASLIHGITTRQAQLGGAPIGFVLAAFFDEWTRAGRVVAHNYVFDVNVVAADMHRTGRDISAQRLKQSKRGFCTKEASTAFCAIRKQGGRPGYKWPKLEELHRKLFATDFDGAHNALNDVMATKRCFFELKDRGIIDV